MSTSAKVFTSREAVSALLAGGAPDRVLSARASAVEKLRDDLALLVRWPALQASLETDAQALRAAVKAPPAHLALARRGARTAWTPV